MKFGITVIILFIISETALCQGKYDANWCFGIKAGINFNDTLNPINFNTLCNTSVAVACISDSSGNLLFYIAPDTPFNINTVFYTNMAIFNANNQIIPNGDSIVVGDNLTGSLFLPFNAEQDKYLLFYMLRDSTYNNLYYCQIIKSGEEFMVAKKNQLILSLPIEWGITAVKHANGNDWWILVHKSDVNGSIPTNRFYKFLVTDNSIQGPDSQDIGSIHYSADAFIGQLKFSKNGNWLVSSLADQNAADLFNFNRCTGQLQNFISINNIDSFDNNEISDCEFSEDDKMLYVSEGFNDISPRSALYQYSLNDTNIISSKITIWYTDSIETSFGNLLRANNNKIYLAIDNDGGHPYKINEYNQFNQYLWVINNPDSIGTVCNFQPYGYYLGDSARTYWALPNMPNYNLGPLETGVWGSTLSNDTFICTNIDTPTKGASLHATAPNGVVITWQAGLDIDTSNIHNTLQIVNPLQSSWYYVTFTDTNNTSACNSRTDSVYVEVKECTEGIQQINSSGQHLIIYPNPAQNFATVEWQPVDVGDYSLEIYDLPGRQLYNQKVDGALGKTEIDVSDLANGLYVVRVLSSAGEGMGGGKLAIAR